MAHSVSARKRIRQNEKRRDRNRGRKTRIKSEVRRLDAALDAGNKADAAAQLKVASRVVDKIAATGTIHKRKAARLKSRLAKRVNKAK
ncbi:MAG: 30S ribosomal protein S20 [Phycisphaerae bacterium]|nr:30S ribosomal protein S20 [Phycisphaerae bacterium]